MPSPDKPEFPPLLEPGFHPMTIGEVEQRCVEAFPSSISRRQIFNGLKDVIDRLLAAEIVGELWLNGSFMTRKENPEDCDMVLCISNELTDNATEVQANAVNWMNSNEPKINHHCHSFVFVVYPPGHAMHWIGEWLRAHWIRQFGFSRSRDMKGMALVTLARGAS